ncbi:response regulator transcription factor [Streptomyces sp. NPDC058620]|uniref:response regulator transcription factor n=1 Tax=Streptomyces sp. NPDC058620 TaxID=3346560 RepID=UPI00364AA87F
MDVLTETLSAGPGTDRQPLSVARGRAAGAEALHTEIDNPLDLIAGHQLLAESGDMRAVQVPASRRRPADPRCACGHPLCTEGEGGRDTTRVFLVESHPVTSAGLRSVLAAVPGMTVVGSSAGTARAVEAVRRIRPDVILLGGGGALSDHLAAAARLRAPDGAPQARVLLLRRAESTTEASRILLAGASGCFPLDLAEDRIIAAVSMAADGGTVFLPAPPPARVQPSGPQAHMTESPPQLCNLTAREREVLAQLARGLSNAEIGRALALAEATVKKHLTQAMRKTGQPDRLRAALYAHRHGLAG